MNIDKYERDLLMHLNVDPLIGWPTEYFAVFWFDVLNRLLERGYVETGNGYFTITPDGIQALNGRAKEGRQ